MQILLTNDDGITAPGLVALYRAVADMGDVHVVAPDSVQSATSHGITLHTPLLTSRVSVEGVFSGIAVDGRPADCVKLAVTQLLTSKPDLVLSGINSGANVGINVIYSGTVAAAIEAAFLGVPAIAFSLHLRGPLEPDYARAAGLARGVIEQILAGGLAPRHVATVNIPALDPNEMPAGIRIVRQSVSTTEDKYERRKDPRGRDYFWNTSGFSLEQGPEETDIAALREKYITITPLRFDLTDYDLLKSWSQRQWRVNS